MRRLRRLTDRSRPARASRRRPTRLARLAPLAAVAISATWLLAGQASAHGELVEGAPGPGSTVAPGSEAVQLRFADIDRDRAAQIAVLDADDAPLRVGQVRPASADTVCVRTEGLESGVHTVEYAVPSVDGHVFRGRYAFEVAAGGDPVATPACEGVTLGELGEARTLEQMSDDEIPAWVPYAAAPAVLVAVLGVIWRVRRDRRTSPAA